MSISNPVTGASEVSVGESSVGLDPAVRTIGLSHIYHEMNAVPQAGESRHIASSEYGWSIIKNTTRLDMNLSLGKQV